MTTELEQALEAEQIDTDAPASPGELRPSQLRRVAALTAARGALMNRQVFGESVGSWTTDDLLAVADWIVSGPAESEQKSPSFIAFMGQVLQKPEAFEEFERAQAEPEPGPVGEQPGPTWPPVDHLADDQSAPAQPEPFRASKRAWPYDAEPEPSTGGEDDSEPDDHR